MRICVAHETVFRYASPPSGVIQTVRLTPRNHNGQYVLDWRIDVSADCRLDPQEDAFGNIVHAFSADGPIEELRVVVEGEVETQDVAGIVRGAMERFPPSLYLRETPLTRADDALLAYAAQIAAPQAESSRGGGSAADGDERDVAQSGVNDATLPMLHALLVRLHEDMPLDHAAAEPSATAAEAFARRRGRCQDIAHVFAAVARALGVPARCISGYFHASEDAAAPNGGHVWVEAHVPGLGWVGFDPVNGFCVTDRHVRVAIGLDYLGASPVRSAHYGGGSEAQAVTLTVTQASGQAQE
jgi:transglutaminase-like putative cysteine protease